MGGFQGVLPGRVVGAQALTPIRRRPAGPGRRPAGRRSGATKALLAPAAQSAGVEVPLDFYKILQISRVASRENATRAYERSLASPPEPHYSKEALLARASILKGALDTLLDTSARKDYDERLLVGDVVEAVPAEYVAGALALLQEAGEAGAVAAAGQQWLAAHRRSEAAPDVALATALALCGLARSSLEEQGGVAQAVGQLEGALQLLCTHQPGLAELRREVEGAIQELQPQLAVALLALPLDAPDAGPQRARGLAVAESVLRAAAGSSGSVRAAGHTAFVQQLVGCLTATEQVRLYQECGPSFAESPAEIYVVALAYIAEGAAKLRPALLQRAAELLLLPAPLPPDVPEGQREKRAAEERAKRSVALAVCCLLLGDAPGAEDALGLSTGADGPSAGAKCDRAVLQFIKANSPDRTDLLPGLCVLAQRWVHDVAFGSFRQPYDVAFSLEAWFAAPSVQRALKTLEQGGSLLDGPAFGSQGLVSALGQGLGLLTSPFLSGMAGALSLMGLLDRGSQGGGGEASAAAQPPARQQPQQQQRLGASSQPQQQQRLGASSQPPRGPAAAAAAVVQDLPSDGDDMSVVDLRAARQARQAAWAQQAPPQRPQAPAAPSMVAAAPLEAADPLPPAAHPSASDSASPAASTGPEWLGDVSPSSSAPAAAAAAPEAAAPPAAAAGASSRPSRLRRGARASPTAATGPAVAPIAPEVAFVDEFATQPVPRPPPLAGEDGWLAEAYETRYVRWGRVVGTAVLFAGTMLLGQLAVRGVAPQLSAAPAAAVAAAEAGAAAAAPAAVRAPLSRAEAAAVVSQWQQAKSEALGRSHAAGRLDRVLSGALLEQWRERAAAVKANGWHYMHKLEASSVESVAPGPSAGSAVVTASFKEAAELHKPGENPQVYRSEYTVSYELVKEKGRWKIAGAQVQQ